MGFAAPRRWRWRLVGPPVTPGRGCGEGAHRLQDFSEWGVWLVGQHLPGGRKGPLLRAAQPRRPAARDALPLGELFGCFCWLGCTLRHAPRRRKEPGHLGRCGLDWAGKGELTSYAPVINPRPRSVFSFMQALGKAGAAAAV